MRHILECPTCSQQFQVLAEQAGTQVKCPACETVVAIPDNLGEPTPAPEPSSERANAPPHSVFSCPLCQGTFGVTPEMMNSQVICPHCSKTVNIAARNQPPMTEQRESLPTPPAIKSKLPTTDALKPKKRVPNPSQPKSNQPVESGPENPRDSAPPITSASVKPKQRWKDVHEPDSDLFAPGHGHDSSEDTIISDGQLTNGELGRPKAKDAEQRAEKPKKRRSRYATSQLIDEEPEPVVQERQNVDHLLPPPFNVLDPEALFIKVGDEENKVVLPDGKGGLQKIDKRMVRVQHGGAEVHLMTSTDAERARRRLITNIATISILMIILATVFFLLRRFV